MLSRFVRIQLVTFSLASVLGLTVMVVVYLQAPTMLGIGRITVEMELPDTGGLYRLSNVTYRGVQVGKVTRVKLTRTGAEATLSLVTTPRIPADLDAQVRSVSAIGEQYVDLRPRTSSAPYLRDGSVIDARKTSIPQPVGPMLDRVSALLGSIPKDKLHALIDESSKGFNGAGFDFGSLLDSSAKLSHDTHDVADKISSLIDDSSPLLDGQVQSADATRQWAHDFGDVTDQLVADDGHLRTILQTGPAALQEVSRLLSSVKPTLPVLLANLTSLGQIGVTYLPSLEQLLVLIPPYFADLQSIAPNRNATGLPLGNFRIESTDPAACTVGFLPPSQWRSPADTTTMDTPDGLYCKLPQDSPITVRGARNLPCMNHPGKRAPTVQICDSDKPYVPLAMRQHALGPSPLDPNLLAQGVPPDNRINLNDNIFGPDEGTPPPGGLVPPGAPKPPDPPASPAPAPDPATSVPPAADGTAPAAPSSSRTHATPGPSVAVVPYDPRSGRYMSPDGMVAQQSNLAAGYTSKGWQDLVMNRQYLPQ